MFIKFCFINLVFKIQRKIFSRFSRSFFTSFHYRNIRFRKHIYWNSWCLQFLSKARLQDLVKEVDPTEQLDEEVEEMLLQLADDFVETTVNAACLIAKHRHANTVEVKDVQLHLGKEFTATKKSLRIFYDLRLTQYSSA